MFTRPPPTEADRRAEEVYYNNLRRKSGWERICIASDMFDTLSELCKSGIRYRHPDWTEEQVHEEFLRRLR